jgi:hypothetical protein
MEYPPALISIGDGKPVVSGVIEEGVAAMRTERARHWAAERVDEALCWVDEVGWWLAFGCAAILLLAMFMPDWFARTSWFRANGRDNFESVIDSPASYVGLLSLCGLVACIALAIGIWRRWVVASALAAAAFASAAYVAGSSWWGISRGVALLDGQPIQEMVPPRWTVHWPTALPLFVIAAIVGAISALALAVYWQRRAADHR